MPDHPTPADRFLDTAVQPMADNAELQVHARRELEERIDPAKEDASSWNATTEALQRYDSSVWRRRWPLAMVVVSIMVLLECFIPGSGGLIRNAHALAHMGELMGFEPALTPNGPFQDLTSHLTPEQKLIVLGDTSKGTNSLRLAALCARFPDNPAYYADYSIAYALEKKALPPGYLDTAERIDPDNGWFPCFAAAVLADKVADAPKLSSADRKAHVPKKWTIRDPARLEESMKLLAKGSRLPRFESYQALRMKEKLALLAPATDFASFTQRRVFAATQLSPGLVWTNLTGATAAQAELAANTANREDFQHLLEDWRSLTPRLVRKSNDLVDILVAQAYVAGAVANLRDSATRLGLEKESKELEALQARLDTDAAAREAGKADIDKGDIASQRGALLDSGAALLGYQTVRPTPINSDTLAPGRLGDQGWVGRIVCLFFAKVLLLGCGFSALSRLIGRKIVLRTSARLAGTLTTLDWLWILGCGSVLPVVYHETLYRLTPLGGRDWSIAYTHFMVPLVQLTAWGFLLTLSPLLVGCWRIGKRLEGLNLGLPRAGLLWAANGILAAAMPIAGIAYLGGNPKLWAIAGAACLVVFAVGVAGWALFHRRALVLGHHAATRSVMAPLALSVLLLALLSLAYHAQERYWIPRNSISPGRSGKEGWSSYESAVVVERKAEVLEILAPLGTPR